LVLPPLPPSPPQSLEHLLEPFLDEAVRRELRISRALAAGDVDLAAQLEARSSRRTALFADVQVNLRSLPCA
jgi:hypothetical protein